MRHGLIAFLVLLVPALIGSRAQGSEVLIDGDFADPDWIVVDLISGTSTIDLVATQPTGGNPDAFRQVDISLGQTTFDAAVSLHTYAPSDWNTDRQGPIYSVDVSLDFRSLVGTPTRVGVVAYQVATGDYFAWVASADAINVDWETFSATGLVAEDFDPIMLGETGHPDFSPGAGEVRFGFAVGQFWLFSGGATEISGGVDNWRVEINPLPQAAQWADGDFADPDWNVVDLISGTSTIDLIATQPTGGNPDAFRQVDLSLGQTTFDAAVSLHTYAPSSWSTDLQGPIYSVDVSLDFRSLAGTPTRVGVIAYQVATGDYFAWVASADAINVDWETFSATGLVAGDFDPIMLGESGHPDFSPGAGEVRFGFAVGQFWLFSGGATEISGGVDNWSVAVNPLPQQAQWEDGDFADPDWTVVDLISGTSTINLVATQSAGGNPDAFRQVDLSLGQTTFDAAVSLHTYAPSSWSTDLQGHIYSVSVSLDFRSLIGTPTRVGVVAYQVATDEYYAWVASADATNLDWQTFSATGLVAEDFDPIMLGETGHPDFSPGAGEVRFGFAVGQFWLFSGGATDISGGVDNWSVAINSDPVVTAAPDDPEIVQALPIRLSNGPNPFNPRTTIAFELPEAGVVNLVVLDVRGRLVRTLLRDERRAQGAGRVIWDGRDLHGREAASGLYFAVLRTETRQQASKMMLVR